MDGHSEGLVGREAELGRLRAVVDGVAAVPPAGAVPPPTAGGTGDPAPRTATPAVPCTAVLAGPLGVGKTALLERAVARAGGAGVRVLRAEGSETEAGLAYATLHQLLRPVADETRALPARSRAALDRALGLPARGPADPLRTGTALLTLLSALAATRPLLLAVDDAQWCDPASLDALAFAVRRLAPDPDPDAPGPEPVALLLATRAPARLPSFGRAATTLGIGPLAPDAAARLLAAGPPLPAPTRARLLSEAAGNPLALTELARAAGEAPPGAPGPLPLPALVEELLAARALALPAATREALLLLAAADSADAALAAGLPGPGEPVWRPAAEAGLLDAATARFRHPLARAAVYHAAPARERHAAHRTLAGLLADAPDRRAWHLAAACTGPDAAVSAALVRTAARARRRGGHAAAARALHRAAALAPGREESARLLARAVGAAAAAGDLAWAQELADAVGARTEDPVPRAAAAVHTGRLAALTARHGTALARLGESAARLAPSSPVAALDLLASAATVAYYTGESGGLADRLPAGTSLPHTWVRVVTDPHGARTAAVAHLGSLVERAGTRELPTLAVLAWLLDETPLAVRLVDRGAEAWAGRGGLPEGLAGAVAWAYLERGRRADAGEAARRLAEVGRGAGLAHAVACALAVGATLRAYRGDAEGARRDAEEALARVDPLESRAVAVAARRALGAAAAAEGAHERAYEHLRAVFTAEGAPVHAHAAYPALADLAAAAVRTGHGAEAAAIVARAERALGAEVSPRSRAVLARARGLLAEPGEAEPWFLAALADPYLAHWPFERALTLLDFAEWLRRRRRIAEARAPLAEALETFLRLGARPWAERARAESRAAGVAADPTAADRTGPAALAGLSPQQREIVVLAARGLTNREIGEKLFLSPRTVGSHLYRTFPKLGVTARGQLRDLVDEAA
ncbi:AAA family ATPase [Streptomyces sp. P6-2-1]|uniref:helix-turn-helix transcriptional regulator n=1 Tax=Streptomyces sp. P6-2-1 TaxID=3422591 RepID=UPI003D36B674